MFQSGSTLFVAGTGRARSGRLPQHRPRRELGRVDSGMTPEAIVWGTPKNVYAMYAWACSNCNLGTQFETAPQPGTVWTKGAVPAALVMGPNSLVVTNDGTHYVFVGLMWDQGIWRYVEP
jgi:hypothetical protein